jgi:hypothetical protein
LAYGRHWTGLLLALAQVGQMTGTRAVFLSQWNGEGCEDWLSDPYAYDQTVRAVNFILEAFRPHGSIETPHERFGLPAAALARLGEGFARDALGALANPTEKQAHDRVAQSIHERLADLIPSMRVEPDRPVQATMKSPPRR